MTPATLPQDKLGSHVQSLTTPRNPTKPNRIPGIRQQRQWRMNQAVKRWEAVEPRPRSVLGVVSTGAVGWARMRLNQAVKRWYAVEPRPRSVLGVVSTGAVGWARMRLNQAVKRLEAVEPRPRSVLGVVSTGAVGWACLKRICVVCFPIKRMEIGVGGGLGLVGFPKYPPDPARPRPHFV